MEGKARSSANALRHGLCSTRAVVPGEDRAEFSEFRDGLWADLQPVGALEESLVERIVGALWRLRRVVRIEGELLGQAGQPRLLESAVRGLKLGRSINPSSQLGWSFASADSKSLDQVARHEVRLERSLRANLGELERRQLARRAQDPATRIEVRDEVPLPDGASGSDGGFVLKEAGQQLRSQDRPRTLDDIFGA